LATDRTLRLRPYSPGDLEAFEPRPEFREDMAASDWDWEASLPPGRVWTLARRNGEILGVGGLGDAGDNWQAWAILGEIRAKDLVRALWLAERELSRFMRALDGKPLMSFARAGNEAAIRCLAYLKFQVRGAFPPYVAMQRVEA
jgi:RimJ/RimL family protein N-acetyltransferase